MIPVLQGKHIVLGVTGSIAAYKAVFLASRLHQAGAVVDVIMTDAAMELVRPLTFQAITHRPVVTTMFSLLAETEIGHVTLAKQADLLLIAPATANTIARLAAGLTDNMLAATALATRAPIVIAPAMETGMWENPLTQANLVRLKETRDVTVISPAAGHLASDVSGIGRMVEPDEIVEVVRVVLGRHGDLAGRHVIVTAGGTREPIDPVRFVGNHSSGKMGYALAAATRDRGARVTLIHAETSLAPIYAVTDIPVTTAQQMRDAVFSCLPGADAVLMAAAVADFRPVVASNHKIKKRPDTTGLTIEMERTPDILAEVGHWRRSRRSSAPPPLHPSAPPLPILVGFAAETEDLIGNARAKLESKGADLIVANPVPQAFGSDLNQATLLLADGTVEELPLLSKAELSERILDAVVRKLSESW
jgi:phosphopantothenoylcysteine decarboxylase/phosphopantothenate--cysteine ligase